MEVASLASALAYAMIFARQPAASKQSSSLPSTLISDDMFYIVVKDSMIAASSYIAAL